eukprot:gene12199-16342_t
MIIGIIGINLFLFLHLTSTTSVHGFNSHIVQKYLLQYSKHSHSPIEQSQKIKPNRLGVPVISTIRRCNAEDNQNEKLSKDSEIYNIKAGEPEGYISSDLSSIGDDKQLRVFLYIALALVPCLFLVPFYMSRDFVPPTDF